MTRRELAVGSGAVALSGLVGMAAEGMDLPAKADFTAGEYEVCLNNARWHPLGTGAKKAINGYLDYKARGVWTPPDEVSAAQLDVKSAFARLINAEATEIAYVNRTAGESLFVAGLGFPAAGGNIVTDALHFEGSLYLYDALRRQGMDVRVVRPRDWGIQMADLDRAIDKNTRLVAVSVVSYINGFEHDMKAVCELAHAHGALVYGDAVQAAGAIPIDVRDWGVDALGSASYTWLMGDMGLGFLYVRQDVVPRIKRTQFGYRQLAEFQYHAFSWDTPGPYPVDWKQRNDAAGLFEIGTYANSTIAALNYSLPSIQRLGVERIQEHAQSLLGPLRKQLPRLGYACITPEKSRAPIASFLVPDAAETEAALRRAKVDVSFSRGRMRISPSVYNDAGDTAKLLAALQS